MEIFVAEVGDSPRDDQIYRLTYQGSVADEHNYAAFYSSHGPAVSVPLLPSLSGLFRGEPATGVAIICFVVAGVAYIIRRVRADRRKRRAATVGG